MSRTSTILMAIGLLSTAITAAMLPLHRFSQLDFVLPLLGPVLALVSVFIKPQAATDSRLGALVLACLGVLLVAGSTFGLVFIADMVLHPASGVFQYVVSPAKFVTGVLFSATAAFSLAGGLALRFRLSRAQFAMWFTAALALPLATLGLFLVWDRILRASSL